MSSLRHWIYERIPISMEALRKPLREQLPVHLKEWIFCLGGTPFILFIIMAVTGIALTFYYVPYPMHAHESVSAITYKVRLGWFVRGIHRTASHLMIFTLMLHMIRVFVTRAYRKPRELNWMIGVALFLITLGFGFTGYSLVYDQLSYWATTVGTSMIGQTPVIGKPLLYLIRGGAEVNPYTLSRFYDLHIGVLPSLFTLLIIGHIVLLRMHSVARLEGDTRTQTYHFFPDHVLKESIIGLLLLIGLVNYVTYFPPGIGPPADPTQSPSEIRPEWYFFPSYRWLKIVPLQVGLWTSFAFLIGMLLWPFIDRFFEKLAPGRGIARIVGVLMFLFTLFLLLWEAVKG